MKVYVERGNILYSNYQNNAIPTISLIGDDNINLQLNDNYEEQGAQAFLNKDDITKNIIGNCTIFCYPFGHYNDNAINVLKDAGYKLAFTTKSGRVYPGQNKFALPRIRMSKGISMSAFKEAVK